MHKPVSINNPVKHGSLYKRDATFDIHSTTCQQIFYCSTMQKFFRHLP